jgi:mRNA interferase MazF
VRRGQIYWANLGPPAGRRPVIVLTRDAAIPVLTGVVVAQVTRTIRDIASEVQLGPDEGLPEECVATCDNLVTLSKEFFDAEPVGALDPVRTPELDFALRFALGIGY